MRGGITKAANITTVMLASVVAWVPLFDIVSDYVFLFTTFVFRFNAEEFEQYEAYRQKVKKAFAASLALIYVSHLRGKLN